MLRHGLSLAVLLALVLGTGIAAWAETIEAVGKSGGDDGHRWESQGRKSPKKAAVGKPDGRLEVKVKNGDVISFKVDSGKHGVLFEKAAKEMTEGVWEIVKGSGELKELPATSPFDRFDRKTARTTDPQGMGSKLIEIKIKNLKPGTGNGILFACNPHSSMGDATMTSMLGVIVLAEEKKEKKD